MATWIPDGYTESGYVCGVPNLYEPVRFKFRPMLADQRTAWAIERDKLPAVQRNRKEAELVARQLVEWNLKVSEKAAGGQFQAGDPIPLTVANVLRLNPVLLARLVSIVCGIDPYDDDPEAPPAKRFDEAASAKN